MRDSAISAALPILLAACQTSVPAGTGLTMTTNAAASGVPDYVEAICADCHAVTADTLSINPEAPGFADIANSPGLTRDTLVAFLSDAHNYPMQMDVDLSEDDIALIADYIVTLQSEDYHRTPM